MVPARFETRREINLGGDDTINGDAAPGRGGDPHVTTPERRLAPWLGDYPVMAVPSLVARAKWPVATYHGHAAAGLGKNWIGRMAVAEIRRAPRVTFATGFDVARTEAEPMHLKARKPRFIAKSVSPAM